MAQVQGLLVDNIDFPKNFIRQALIAGGFSIEEAEFDTCRGTSHVIVWLQSKAKFKIARDSFLAYQVESHKKLYVKQALKEATPAPKRQVDEHEHPKISRVRESLARLIRNNDTLRLRQPAASSPSETGPSLSANTVTPNAEPEQQPVLPEKEDASAVGQVARSLSMIELDPDRKRFRGSEKREGKEGEEMENSQEDERSRPKRRRLEETGKS